MAGPISSSGLAGMFDGRVDVQPPLSDQQLREIPTKRGVFLLTAEDDRPILLTTAASIRSRLRGRLDEKDPTQSSRSADLRHITRAVHWKLAGGHFETDWRYLELARRIWPKSYQKILSWKPPWFVHVAPAEPYPHFKRTRDVFASAGRYVGPFETARSAEKFVEIVQDAFDLCRDIQCLRRSPNAHRCAYGQMGRCLSPCDGTISMDEYRQHVARAAEFAAGMRTERFEQLTEQMQSAARELRFEQASALKARIERLAELDAPAYSHVAPAENFRFLMIQPSGSRRRAEVFLADRGEVVQANPLAWPLDEKKVQRRIDRMARLVASAKAPITDATGRWRIGLVARALMVGVSRGGLLIRWRDDLQAEDLCKAVAAVAGELGLSTKLRSPKNDNRNSETPEVRKSSESSG